MGNVFNYLLVSLCVADLMVIFTNLVHAVKTLVPASFIPNQLVVINEAVSHIAVTTGIFLIMAITVERYFGVCSAFTYQARVAEKGPILILCSYIIPAILGAVLLNIPKILSIGDFFHIDSMSPAIKNTYIKVAITYQVIHPLTTTCIIPILVLSILNTKILLRANRIQSSRMKNEKRLVKVMVMVVGVFIILSVPKMSLALYEVSTIPNILECYRRTCKYYVSSGRWVADIITRYLVLLNSSVNFIIYCFAGATFRKVLCELLKKVWLVKIMRAKESITEVSKAMRKMFETVMMRKKNMRDELREEHSSNKQMPCEVSAV